MKYEKGQSGNPAGRPKGTANRTTTNVKMFIQSIIDDNADELKKDFRELNGAEKWRIMEKLFAYICPKQQSVKAELTATATQYQKRVVGLSISEITEMHDKGISGIFSTDEIITMNEKGIETRTLIELLSTIKEKMQLPESPVNNR